MPCHLSDIYSPRARFNYATCLYFDPATVTPVVEETEGRAGRYELSLGPEIAVFRDCFGMPTKRHMRSLSSVYPQTSNAANAIPLIRLPLSAAHGRCYSVVAVARWFRDLARKKVARCAQSYQRRDRAPRSLGHQGSRTRVGDDATVCVSLLTVFLDPI
jgi:hypothetical protein